MLDLAGEEKRPGPQTPGLLAYRKKNAICLASELKTSAVAL
jgi:hypothetical protein